MTDHQHKVRRLAGALGAEIAGVDLGEIRDAETVAAIRRALLEHHVLVLRDQKLTPAEQLDFARALGEPEIHPIANGLAEFPEVIRVLKPAGERAFFGTSWHSDNSFFERPSAVTILYGETRPSNGADTQLPCMERAWEEQAAPIHGFHVPRLAVHCA
jgi:taurine dioxygenase